MLLLLNEKVCNVLENDVSNWKSVLWFEFLTLALHTISCILLSAYKGLIFNILSNG